MSGIFFDGPPGKILMLWQQGKIKLVVCKEILHEYTRVSHELSKKLESINVDKIISLISLYSEAVTPVKLTGEICDDPDDNKFIACALGGKVKTIVSGDKHLLKINGIYDLEILKPREFLDKYF
jgi:putative PIN family toxin of toxin-antitoxin system